MKKDVTLFYEGRISPGWRKRFQDGEIRSIPSGLSTSFSGLKRLLNFLNKLREFDRIIIHHHVEPILAYYLSKFLGLKIVWYSGSVFELAWEEVITGIDYRRISPTVKRTSNEFYGGAVSNLLLSDPLYGLTTRIARAVDIETVRGFGKVLANSHFLSKFLLRTYGLKEPPSVVYPGPDPLLEQLASENHSIEQDYMLSVGSLIPLKNVESMIRAAADVRSSKIVLVGDGQERSRLKDLGAELDVPIEFRGTLDGEGDLARAYGECEFLVHLSLYEPFGLTPIEAGLFSKPSIVTNRGGPPETVVDGVTGYVVNPLDYKEVGLKMNQLFVDESLRHSMGEKARKNIIENFTLRKSAEQLLAEM